MFVSKIKPDHIINISILIVGSILLSFGIANESFWADEAFTGVMVRHSFADIYEYCKVEMHSAFYYAVLKVYSLIFGSGEVSLRSFSLLGTVALAALGPTAIKRLFNRFTGYLFSIIVFVTPTLLVYSQEARMYTWAAFFTAAAALYAALAHKEQKRKDLILFALFLLASMYIHIIGLVAGFFFNLIFLIILLIRKEFPFIKKYVIAAAVAALLFIPRIPYLLAQAAQVNERFWIPPVSADRIKYSLQFMFGLKFSFTPISVLITMLVFMTILAGLLYLVIKRDKNIQFLLITFAAYISIFLFVILYSLYKKPILEPRYMIIAGSWLLILFSAVTYRFHKIAAASIVLIFVVLSVKVNMETYMHNYNGPMFNVVDDLSNRIFDNDIFIHSDELTLGCFTYYFPNHKHYFLFTDRAEVYWHLEIFKKYGGYGPQLDEFTKGVSRLWFIQRAGGLNKGLYTHQLGKYGMSRYTKTYSQENAWFRPEVELYYNKE